MKKTLLLLLILPSIATAQDQSKILEARSDERRKACDGFTDVATDFYNGYADGGTLDQIHKAIEIEIADENWAYVAKLLADIANDYHERDASESDLHIDLLHRCVTTSGTLDRAIASLWLETVSEAHPWYETVQTMMSMSNEEIEAFDMESSNPDTVARLTSKLLDAVPHSLEPFERRNEGQLTGCGVEFGLTGQDFAYKNGGIVFLKGSLMVLHARSTVTTVLKVLPYDMPFSTDTSTSDMKMFDISYAYLKTPNGIALPNKETAFECEFGGICVAFSDEYFETVISAISDGQFSIVYTRVDGQTDVEIPVVTDRVDSYEEYVGKNLQCMAELIDVMQAQGYGK